MHVVGLVTEYNPFHSGHEYHIKKALEITGADYCVAVMSGSFVQRGEPAIYDKYARTRAALLSGAHVVFEMPVAFSTASAREFSHYAVTLLDSLGVVDSICFGSEAGDITVLKSLSDLMSEETGSYRDALKKSLKSGLTYPRAREAAFRASAPEDTTDLLLSHLSQPNNILGLEYMIALKKLQSRIKPYTIKRAGTGYHDPSLSGTFISAYAIRRSLAEPRDSNALKNMVPASAYSVFEHQVPIFLNDFSELLNYKLAELIYQQQDFTSYSDVTGELQRKLERLVPDYSSFKEKLTLLKTKEVTYSRLSRSLIHLLLEIKTEGIDNYKKEGYALYGRILGFREDGLPLLREIKSLSSIPLVNKIADARKTLSPLALSMLNQEIYATRIYQGIQRQKGQIRPDEYQRSVLRISEADCKEWD